jgi:hypothetical protein
LYPTVNATAQANQESQQKIKTLEGELAKMKIVVENLQKEREMALQFNELLLQKLNTVGPVDKGSIISVN